MKEICIEKRTLRLLLCLLPFFIPEYFLSLGKVSAVFELYKIVVALYVIIYWRALEYEFSPIIGIVFLFKLINLIPLFYSGNFSGRTLYLWVKETYTIILLCIIFYNECKKDYAKTIEIAYWIISFSILAHILCFYATGIELLGIRTKLSHSFIVCMILCFVKISSKISKTTIYDFAFFVLSTFYILNRWISTLILVLLVLLLGYIFSKYEIIQRLCNYRLLITSAILLNLSILLLRIQNIFKFIIVDMLHESLTLDYRTYIWDAILPKCLSHLWLGSGIVGENSLGVRIRVINPILGININTAIQSHNQLLSILYHNGIIGLVIYSLMILYVGKYLKLCKNKRIVTILSVGMFAIMLSTVTELTTENLYFYVLLMVIATTAYIKKIKDKEGLSPTI